MIFLRYRFLFYFNITRYEGRRQNRINMITLPVENRIAKGNHSRINIRIVFQAICYIQELRRFSRVHSMLNKNNRYGRSPQYAVCERSQIAICRCRNNKGIICPRHRRRIKSAIPAKTSPLTPGRKKKLLESARTRVLNGCPRKISDRHMVVHTELKSFRHIKRNLMSQSTQLLNENTVKIDLMPAGRHDILKDSDAHVFTPFCLIASSCLFTQVLSVPPRTNLRPYRGRRGRPPARRR